VRACSPRAGRSHAGKTAARVHARRSRAGRRPVRPAHRPPLHASVPGPYGASGTDPAPWKHAWTQWGQRHGPRSIQAAHARTPSALSPRPGEPGTLWLGFPCGRKELVVGGGGERAAPAGACLDFGASMGVSVALGPDRVAFADDACAPLTAAHALGPGPMYLFLGAECAGAECEGCSLSYPKPAHTLYPTLLLPRWRPVKQKVPRWTGPSPGPPCPPCTPGGQPCAFLTPRELQRTRTPASAAPGRWWALCGRSAAPGLRIACPAHPAAPAYARGQAVLVYPMARVRVNDIQYAPALQRVRTCPAQAARCGSAWRWRPAPEARCSGTGKIPRPRRAPRQRRAPRPRRRPAERRASPSSPWSRCALRTPGQRPSRAARRRPVRRCRRRPGSGTSPSRARRCGTRTPRRRGGEGGGCRGWSQRQGRRPALRATGRGRGTALILARSGCCCGARLRRKARRCLTPRCSRRRYSAGCSGGAHARACALRRRPLSQGSARRRAGLGQGPRTLVEAPARWWWPCRPRRRRRRGPRWRPRLSPSRRGATSPSRSRCLVRAGKPSSAPAHSSRVHAGSAAGHAGRHRRGRGRRDTPNARAMITCCLGARTPQQVEPTHACVTAPCA
jgi:hypothetical protein